MASGENEFDTPVLEDNSGFWGVCPCINQVSNIERFSD